MTILERFLNSAEASLYASFLQNEGIDAEVFEDTAFGESGLGAIKNSIRVVVPDEQVDQALEALKNYQRGDDVEG